MMDKHIFLPLLNTLSHMKFAHVLAYSYLCARNGVNTN